MTPGESECQKIYNEGAACLNDRAFKKAIRMFTKAIDHYSPTVDTQHDLAVIHCARSHAYYHLKKMEESQADAERTIELRPTWSKVKRSVTLSSILTRRLRGAELGLLPKS